MSERTFNNPSNLIAFWPALLLVGFASQLFFSPIVVGYRWTAEFSIGFLLLASILIDRLAGRTLSLEMISWRETLFILIPMGLITAWSFISIFWAASPRNVLHHSLVWTSYLLFYVLVRDAIRNKRLLSFTLTTVGLILLVISLSSVVEFVGDEKPLTADFTGRYYLYAEMGICFLPFFYSSSVSTDRRKSVIGLILLASTFAMIIATTSRIMFVSAVVGLMVFCVSRLANERRVPNFRKWAASTGILISIFALFQYPIKGTKSITLSERLSGHEEYSILSSRSRVLLWGMAIEGFRTSPIIGIGADNYFSDYRQLREGFSQRNPDNPIIEINEDLIPERAHSEYLQILCELGLVGLSIFVWLLTGVFLLLILSFKRGVSSTAAAALSGSVAFLISSGASSYSFRFPANGCCFFFLIAVASNELFVTKADKMIKPTALGRSSRAVTIVGLLAAVAVGGFSLLRGISVHYLENSLNTVDLSSANVELEKAIKIDPSEPMFRYYHGVNMSLIGDRERAAEEMRIAINHGIATSIAYYDLASILSGLGNNEETQSAFDEALRVYPRSVFLRTAFASYLKHIGRPEQANAQNEVALRINETQARSWQLAHDEGLESLAQVSRIDQNYVSTFDLKPTSAALALDNFQRHRSK